jgi:hypothetical protein
VRTFLIRYWFRFKTNGVDKMPFGVVVGCGVTAFNYADAISVVQEKVFKGEKIPEREEEIENIDVRTLDQNHVVVNMKDPTLRGVWFPAGYD